MLSVYKTVSNFLLCQISSCNCFLKCLVHLYHLRPSTILLMINSVALIQCACPNDLSFKSTSDKDSKCYQCINLDELLCFLRSLVHISTNRSTRCSTAMLLPSHALVSLVCLFVGCTCTHADRVSHPEGKDVEAMIFPHCLLNRDQRNSENVWLSGLHIWHCRCGESPRINTGKWCSPHDQAKYSALGILVHCIRRRVFTKGKQCISYWRRQIEVCEWTLQGNQQVEDSLGPYCFCITPLRGRIRSSEQVGHRPQQNEMLSVFQVQFFSPPLEDLRAMLDGKRPDCNTAQHI